MSDTIKDVLFESIELCERWSILNRRLTKVLKDKFDNVSKATIRGEFVDIRMDNGRNIYFNLDSKEPHTEQPYMSLDDSLSHDEIIAMVNQNAQIKKDTDAIFEYITSNYKDNNNGNK